MCERNIESLGELLMKVALVHEFLNQFGGGERVLIALKEIFPDAPIYALLLDHQKLPEELTNAQIRVSYLQKWPSFLRKRHKLLLPFYPKAVEQFDLSAFDLIISDSSSFGKGVLTRPDAIHICYCHTPTGYLWHYTEEYLKEQKLSNISVAVAKRILRNLRIWDFQAAQRVDYFIANSKNVQKRIKKYYKRDSEVIYPPVDMSEIRNQKLDSSKIKKDYFLVVSRLSAYKKVDLTIKAFNRLPNEKLKIIGIGSQLNNLKKLAKSNIEFLGFQPDEKLKGYYKNCRALIFPAEEDFGITPIEAMAFGKPIIAYNKGGVLESMVENKTGVFFNKPNVDSLLDAINGFKKRENKFITEEIIKQAEKFDKKVFQDKIKKIVEKVKNA